MNKVVLIVLLLIVPIAANAEKPPFEAITWDDAVNAGYDFKGCHMWYGGKGECVWVSPDATIQQSCYLWGTTNTNLNKATVSCQLIPLTVGADVTPTVPSMNYEPTPAIKITWYEALALPGNPKAKCYHDMHMQACQVTTDEAEVLCRKYQAADKLRCRYFRVTPLN